MSNLQVSPVEAVLGTLRGLIQQVSIPVVQECLKATCSEIAFLTATEGTLEGLATADGESDPNEDGAEAL